MLAPVHAGDVAEGVVADGHEQNHEDSLHAVPAPEVHHRGTHHEGNPQHGQQAAGPGPQRRHPAVGPRSIRSQQKQQQGRAHRKPQPAESRGVTAGHRHRREDPQRDGGDAVAAAGVEDRSHFPDAYPGGHGGKGHQDRLDEKAQHQDEAEAHTHANGGG